MAAIGGAANLAISGLSAAPVSASAAHGQHPLHYEFGSLARANDRFVASTIDPATGDINPYGGAITPVTAGSLVNGDVLVSDFNTFAGTAGAGTSISMVEINPNMGAVADFAHGGPIAGPDSLAFNPNGIESCGSATSVPLRTAPPPMSPFSPTLAGPSRRSTRRPRR